ncbi:MAG: hypothetical protein IJD16_06085 [Desulfovibrio sp.]|nr:hypothetical protein [Desulfovibrio sp.]
MSNISRRIERLESHADRDGTILIIHWELEPSTKAVQCAGQTWRRRSSETLDDLLRRVKKEFAPLPGIHWLSAVA